MRPLRLRLKGFTAFRDEQSIDFEGVELFAIAGPTGSGKSSLLDAMTYALYGEVERVGIQCGQLISQGLPRMSVILDFRVGRDDYRISRVTPRSGPSTVLFERLVNGEAQSVGEGADRVREVKELVKSVVGLDYDAFTRSVLLPQNKFAALLTGDPKKRRDILIELLGLGLFNDMAKRAGQIAKDAEREAASLTAVVAKEYAGVDESALRAAAKEAHEKAERQVKVARANEKAKALASQAEADRRAALELSGCADESAKLADLAKTATNALAAVSKKVADADSLVSGREKASKALGDAHRAASVARADAEKKWGNVATLSEAKAQAQALTRLEKAAQSADAAVKRAQGRRPRVEKDQADCGVALTAAIKKAKGAADDLKSAKKRVAEAEHADRVAAIAAGLKKGAPCPVCGQPLLAAPKSAGSDLRAARAGLQAAEAGDDAARELLSEAKLAKAQGEKDLQRLDDEIGDLRSKALDAATELNATKREVARAFGGKIPEDPVKVLQERISQLDELAATAEKARDDAVEAERALAGARRMRDGLDKEIVQERTRLEMKPDALFARCTKLGIAASSVPKLPALPASAKGVDATVAVGREIAASLTSFARLLKDEAGSRAETEKTLFAQALRAAEVIGPRADRLDALVHELAEAERVSARLATEAKKREEDLAQRLEHRKQMEADIEAKNRRARTFGALALELRADHIVAFLQGEALQAMAGAASVHLAQLSDDRYRLVCRDEDEFFVIDGLNGDEERSVRTLSGGETFLASLALALGLAEQVRALSVSQRARLDSFFLDEGFGSLDPETLDTASDAIQRLAGDGRLVGVITHVSLLSDQFMRIEVIKSPKGASTLRFVSWPQPNTERPVGHGSPAVRIGAPTRAL